MATALVEIILLQSLFHELQIQCDIPMLMINSVSAKVLYHNLIFHARMKHIEMDHHFIRDHVIQGQLVIDYVPSSDQVVDALTKPLHSASFLILHPRLLMLPSLSICGRMLALMI